MIWILVVILLIIVIASTGKSNKKKKLEIQKLEKEVNQEQKPPSSNSVADELAKLKKLKEDGVLSDNEFIAQKTKLLS